MSLATTPITTDERRQLLDSMIVDWTAHGWRIESRTESQAVVSKGHRPNHVLHLLLTIVTASLWGIVWIIVAITSKEKRKTLIVDAYGQTTAR